METQELIASLALTQEAAVTYTDIDQAQDMLQINWDTRAVTIPKSVTNAGVKNDHLSKKLVFSMDRYVCGVDLANHTFAIHFINVDKWDSKKKNYDDCASGVYPVTNIDLSVDGKVTCEWEITNAATQVVGDVVFALHVFTIVDSAFTYHLGTTPTLLDLLDTVNATEHGKNITPDEIEVYIQKMADLSAEIDAKVAAAEAAATRAEEAAANFEVDDTLSVAGKAADAAATGAKLSQLSSEIENVGNGFVNSDLETKNFGIGDTGVINDSSYTAYIIPIKKGIAYNILVTGSDTEFIRMGTNKVGAMVGEKVTLQEPLLIDDTNGFLYEWTCTNDDNYLLMYVTTRKVIVKEKIYTTQVIKDLSYYGDYSDGDNITKILANAINSGNNIEIKKGTYYVDKYSYELNGQIIKGVGVTLKNSVRGTYDSETTDSFITFNGENFEVVGITFDANGLYIARPYHSENTTEEYAEYLSNRHKTIKVVTVSKANNFKISNCTFTNGVVGLRVDECLDFVIEKCTSIYTNADSFFITNGSARGVLHNCVGCYNGDDTFSIVADSNNSLPNNIIVEKCIAYNTMGALACLHGSYNVIVDNCVGYNVGRCPLRLGSISASDGTNLRTGHHQTVSNCIIRCEKLCGGNEGANKKDNNFNSYLIQGYELEKPYDITINNVNIYRETNENNHILVIDKAMNISLISCNFDKFDLSFIDSYKVNVKSNVFKTTKYVKFKSSIDINIVGNDFITDLGLWEGLEDSIFDPCNVLIDSGYRLNFSGNKYLSYATNKSYSISFHPNSESNEYEYHVDTDCVATYNNVSRQIKYDGIWCLSNSNLSPVMSAIGDKQIVLNNNYKIYAIYNHEIKEISTQ